MEFEILPYKGAHPIYFGMTPQQVVGVMGEPKRVSKLWDGRLVYFYGDQAECNVAFSIEHEVVDGIGIGPPAKVLYSGVNLFSDLNIYRKLAIEDGDPREWVGMLHFFHLGITLSGFHDRDESQLGIQIFTKEACNVEIEKTQPFVLD